MKPKHHDTDIDIASLRPPVRDPARWDRSLEYGRRNVEGMPGDCLAFRVRAPGRVLTRLYDSVTWPEYRITQAHVLTAVRQNRNRSITQIADSLFMARPTLSRALKRLALRGFVEFRKGADARARIPVITVRGERYLLIFSSMWKSARTWIEDVLPAAVHERLSDAVIEANRHLWREVERIRLGKAPYFVHG